MPKRNIPGCSDLRRQSVDLDETVRGILVEGVTGIVGGEVVVIQRAVGTASHHHGTAAVHDHANLTGHIPLGVIDERVERMHGRGEPLRIIDQFGPALIDAALDAMLLTFETHVLEFLVGRDEGDGTRCLVELTGLDAHQAILDQIDTADA